MFFVESSVSSHLCPQCQHQMFYRDSRKRILRKEGGEIEWLVIRRFYCPKCHSYHTELPDCLAPHKHYTTATISGAIDGIVTSNDADSEDYPSLQTIIRWIKWFRLNMANIEGYLRSAGCSILGLGKEILFSGDSLLNALRKHRQNWLKTVLPLIYNTGEALHVLPW